MIYIRRHHLGGWYSHKPTCLESAHNRPGQSRWESRATLGR